MSDDVRYPAGRFTWPVSVSVVERARHIDTLAEAPAMLRLAVAGLTEEQLNTPYRDGGWTVRQVIHHVPESHMNSYIRFKLALTEDSPTIKPYDEAAWANLNDIQTTTIEVSLSLLESLHPRWVALLRAIDEEGWKRQFRHPDIGLISLEQNLALYAWHGRHHTAHITSLRSRRNW